MGTENKGGAEDGAAVGCSAWLGDVKSVVTQSKFFLLAGTTVIVKGVAMTLMASVEVSVCESVVESPNDPSSATPPI